MIEFPRTRRAIQAGLHDRLHPGAQIFVSRHGQTMLDEAFGEAREGVPMQADSLALWFSAGKPITAVAIAQLVERGQSEWDTAVAEVVPEFAANGKGTITLRHLLTHTAGLRAADAIEDSLPWDEKIQQICALPPDPGWKPGERAGYHVSGTWYLLGEVVRRISGVSLDEYARENIFARARMKDSSLSLSIADVHRYGARIAFLYDTAGETSQPRLDWNDESGLTRCRPGGSARGPIRELGRFYEALHAGGGTLLNPETVAAVTSRQRTGLLDETFQYRMDWGFGFIVNSNRDGFQMPYGYGRFASHETFGHSGNQVACAFADPAHQLVVAWACNGMPGERRHQQRQRAINNAIYEDLGLADITPN
jgi:CubicO group peptidase (beta-lactamase class C family)